MFKLDMALRTPPGGVQGCSRKELSRIIQVLVEGHKYSYFVCAVGCVFSLFRPVCPGVCAIKYTWTVCTRTVPYNMKLSCHLQEVNYPHWPVQ